MGFKLLQRLNELRLSTSPILVANFAPVTWIALIIFTYHILMRPLRVILPSSGDLVALAAFAYLLITLVYGLLVNYNIVRNPYLPTSTMGRVMGVVRDSQGRLPEKNGGSKVVVFILGASQNHPLGMFSPHLKYLGEQLDNMWKELERNPEKWGFLGRTEPMISQVPGKGNNLVNITYWRTPEDLHRFNASPFHMEVRRWWNASLKEVPHLGIFHETYIVEPHKWETIYENMHPFGMGQIKVPGTDSEDGDAMFNALVPGRGTTMHSRMNWSNAESS